MNALSAQLHQLASEHPQRAAFEAMVAKGWKPERAAMRIDPLPPVVVCAGRLRYRLVNNPHRLALVADLLRKCERKPRRHFGVSGTLYAHPAGFHLFISTDMRRDTLTIGTVVLKLNHVRRTLSGDVPASWLIDLNAGPIEPDPDEEDES